MMVCKRGEAYGAAPVKSDSDRNNTDSRRQAFPARAAGTF